MVSSSSPTNAERSRMENYWKQHSTNSTIETMMLDTNAKTLTQLETPEILSMLPCYKNKDVLELASGIGRYTVEFSKVVKSITAVEFMEEFHNKNVEAHTGQSHASFICEDVTKLEQAPSIYDLVFSNWLFMYLGDAEVKALAKNLLTWLRPNGHMFFRESCFKRSGNAKRGENPTHYRHPSFYIGAFQSVVEEDNGMVSYFELISSKSVTAYRKLKQNSGQICYLWKKITKPKVATMESQIDSFQRYLDEHQYSRQSILRSEHIFGKGYVATGGQSTTTQLVERLQLKPNEKVLDVGCGIGGADIYMAKEFDVSIAGIDLSTNMILIAIERSIQALEPLDISYEIRDATLVDYPEDSFDVIYSRDTLCHVQDKLALFYKFKKWLKPGGRLLITDYCCGSSTSSSVFESYIQAHEYRFIEVAEYAELLRKAGFEHVKAEDATPQFIESLQKELQYAETHKSSIIAATSNADYEEMIQLWQLKLKLCLDGDQCWGTFLATN